MERAAGSYKFTPDPGFRREVERLGFTGVDDRALFIFAMDDLSIAGLTQLRGLVADTLDTVRLRDHGISADYVRRVKEQFKKTPTVEQIIRLRTRGELPR